MAVTRGHGNPRWTEDEIILALDLYFDLDGRIPNESDPSIQDLSKILRSFPYHEEAARKDSFRNPAGVAFKLQNIRQIATGEGLSNTSRADKAVWEQFGSDRVKTKERANLLRSVLSIPRVFEEEAEYDVFQEERLITYAHKKRERSPKLRQKLIDVRTASGTLHCDICGYANLTGDTRFDVAGLEAHHLEPLNRRNRAQSRLEDVVLLCATCHRLAHRAIAITGQWLSLMELRIILGKA